MVCFPISAETKPFSFHSNHLSQDSIWKILSSQFDFPLALTSHCVLPTLRSNIFNIHACNICACVLMCKLLFETVSCLFGRTDYSVPPLMPAASPLGTSLPSSWSELRRDGFFSEQMSSYKSFLVTLMLLAMVMVMVVGINPNEQNPNRQNVLVAFVNYKL